MSDYFLSASCQAMCSSPKKSFGMISIWKSRQSELESEKSVHPFEPQLSLTLSSRNMVKEGCVVKLRGLPFQATLKDVAGFLSGLNYIP